MEFCFLDNYTVDGYLKYLKRAMSEEPDMMTAGRVDEESIRERLNDEFYRNTSSILAIDGGQVIGRIEYHFYGCIQDGYRMAYVDWLYVLRDYRRRGAASGLVAEFEKECAARKIDQFYLIRSENEAANGFYNSFRGAQLSVEAFLRKHLR